MSDKNYIVLGRRKWNTSVFDVTIKTLPGKWFYIDNTAELTYDLVSRINPKYLFFLHWSWKVPEEIIQNFECVCFHMTDVPYGRGGSPLQNLIERGHRETKLTALRMAKDYDAGPVYLKRDLSVEGNAEEIYIRAANLSAEMISFIITNEPKPKPQTGDVVVFKRRKPEQSEILKKSSLLELYDHIRMLDAEGYPKAFLIHEGFRYEFDRAAFYDGKIQADVMITKNEEGS